MTQKIEIWKVLIMMAEAFCMGGKLFCDQNSKTNTVLSIMSIVFGVIFILVV